ncbi:hypothetical protein Taro_043351 [Colocasia esculenta]|uniref:Uncharacterized protein n=1 Tax=Colocasia esculenta TaxID=4460 RepID=A0A843WVI2_COLES|nr:hypothetical protein [Colocasia esculenta]
MSSRVLLFLQILNRVLDPPYHPVFGARSVLFHRQELGVNALAAKISSLRPAILPSNSLNGQRLPLSSSGQNSKGISIAQDSIEPQVPLRLPCYDFTPVEDPTVVCANKITKSLCGTSGTQKSWVIIGPMLRAKPNPRV